MANYSKSSGFARFWAVFMTILLAASIFFGIVTEGFKNWDASTWFKKDVEKGSVIDGDGNEMNGDTVYNMPSNMVFRPALRGATPATSVTIKAVIEPLDATNQLVDWTIAFADPSAAWANGKTLSDYVTITDTNELTTTVTFKQAFGAQIIITVTSQDNPEYSDTCTVDCAQKLASTYAQYAAGAGLEGDTAVTLNNASGTASNWAIFKAFLTKDVQKAATYTYNTTEVYTIEDTYTTTVSIAPSAALLAAAKKINANAVGGSHRKHGLFRAITRRGLCDSPQPLRTRQSARQEKRCGAVRGNGNDFEHVHGGRDGHLLSGVCGKQYRQSGHGYPDRGRHDHLLSR